MFLCNDCCESKMLFLTQILSRGKCEGCGTVATCVHEVTTHKKQGRSQWLTYGGAWFTCVCGNDFFTIKGWFIHCTCGKIYDRRDNL